MWKDFLGMLVLVIAMTFLILVPITITMALLSFIFEPLGVCR